LTDGLRLRVIDDRLVAGPAGQNPAGYEIERRPFYVTRDGVGKAIMSVLA
jgi:hypothetical protein